MRDLGADIFFNMPGRAIYALLNELPGVNGIRHVTALHESTLTNAADGYARATGRPSWVNLYYSTGLMNGLNGMYMAYRDHVPLVVTATQTESYAVGANNRAECEDVLSLVRPVTKWASQPTRADRVQEALVRAWTIASTPPMGPCFVALPVDFFNEEVPYDPIPQPARGEAVPADISIVTDWLAGAEAPILVVGSEAVQIGAMELVEKLADTLKAPLFPEPHSSFPEGWRTTMFGGLAGYYHDLVENSDLILYVNVSTMEQHHRKSYTAGRPKRHVQIVTDEIRLNEHIPADWITFGHPRPTMQALLRAISTRKLDKTLLEKRGKAVEARFEKRRRDIAEKTKQVWETTPMSPARFYAELRKCVPQEAMIVEYVTTSSPAFRQNFPVPSPRHYIAASGSNQGWAIAASIGVKAANPDKPVLAVVGDGGFMFNAQALYTAVSHDLPVIAVVMNNGGWGSMRRSVKQGAPAVIEHGIDLKFGWEIDLEGLGKSLGARAATVEKPDQIAGVVDDALKCGKTFVINAKVSSIPTEIDEKAR